LALIVLLLAAHVKLTALIWLPAFALWMIWRHGWRSALKTGLAAAVCGLALSWLMYAPFDGWQTLPRMLKERSAFLANSPWQVIKYYLTETRHWYYLRANRLTTGLSNAFSLAGALLIPLWMFNFRPKRWRFSPSSLTDEHQTFWRALTAVSFLFLLLGTFWFQHWYVLWLLVPAVLLPSSRLTRLLLPWLAFGALSSNAVMGFITASLPQATLQIQKAALSVAITWGPLLLAVLISALRRRFVPSPSQP